jgi:murein DD-endopeptidase MepM/ murein hydrolase activator NlpD
VCSSDLAFHTGIDIAAPRGTPVKAVADGTVTEAGKSEVYGSYIIIEHKDSISSFYGHCDKLGVKKGSKVNAGQIIASVGDTGLSTGNHLHFEVRKNGVAIDPAPLLWPN